MNDKSMIAVAVEVLGNNKGKMTFKELWEEVRKECDISDEEVADRIGHFYTDLSLSGEIKYIPGQPGDDKKDIPAEEAAFDLASRYKFEKSENEYEDAAAEDESESEESEGEPGEENDDEERDDEFDDDSGEHSDSMQDIDLNPDNSEGNF